MKTIKVSEATDIQLDWLVATLQESIDGEYGYSKIYEGNDAGKPRKYIANQYGHTFAPTTSWSQMGPIIDREKISIRHWDNTPVIHAYLPTPGSDWSEGQTPLIAAARCYVTSKLGATAAIPDEL